MSRIHCYGMTVRITFMKFQLGSPRTSSYLFRVTKYLSIVLIFYTFVFFLFPHIKPSSLTITDSDIDFETRTSPVYNGFLPLTNAHQLCAAHDLAPYQPRTHPRKIYDLFMINNELDWLDIRLHEMSSEVDYFVILEAPHTFTGLPKNMSFQTQRSQFAAFDKKIIYHVLEDAPPPIDPTAQPGSKDYEANAWIQEKFQRDAMFSQVFPKLSGDQRPHEGDVILVSDVDELIRPATLQLLRNCAFPLILTLRSQFYYYSFQFRHRGEQWRHPQATFFRGMDNTILPHSLRSRHGGAVQVDERDSKQVADLWNAGWHCSSCFATLREMRRKMESFSHTNLNAEEFRRTERIVDRVGQGKDLWDRFGQWYKRIDHNQDVPQYIKENPVKYSYMINRDGEGAGFIDYEESISLDLV
ncbi:glycosyltransferase family 17 protein [Rutstroemia sp. NJR-2017a BBW]|nr:glycosyltransferase family 17 protein [Rutstroemia sp. NJR-2017a BBW]